VVFREFSSLWWFCRGEPPQSFSESRLRAASLVKEEWGGRSVLVMSFYDSPPGGRGKKESGGGGGMKVEKKGRSARVSD